jgi:hypothetical protein
MESLEIPMFPVSAIVTPFANLWLLLFDDVLCQIHFCSTRH